MGEPVRVSAEVLAGLAAVRESGVVNLLDREAVQYHAHHFGSPETVVWIEDNRESYATGIFYGFTASEGNNSDT